MTKSVFVVIATLVILACPIFGDSEPNEMNLQTPADFSPPLDKEPAQDLAISDPTDPEWMSGSCSASYNCGDGNTISCTGTSSCRITQVGFLHVVECDGNRTFCPNSCTVQELCSPGVLTCGSDVGDCQQGNDWVQCDGTRFDCPNISPEFPEP